MQKIGNLILLFLVLLIPMSYFTFNSNTAYAVSYTGRVDSATNQSKLSKSEAINNNVFDKLKVIVSGITGVGALTLMVLFLKNIFELGNSVNNAPEHAAALRGLLMTGVGLALLGGLTTMMLISSGIFN